MQTTETLDDAARRAVTALVGRVAEADGVSPLNDSATLVVDGERDGEFLLAHSDGDLAGLAVVDAREQTVLVAVDPAHRRRGHGTSLLRAALAAHPDHAVWAFGTSPAAAALARSVDLRPVRGLLKLGRALGDERVSGVPEGYRVTTFSPDDAEAVVAVNAAAFAHHPEQGRLTVDEFTSLTRQPWFSADGLFLARRADDVAGFHWTKRHDETTGEVYVLAVHPDHGGAGLGRVLLETGLAHLADVGCTRVVLYVEEAEERVVALYRAAGFEEISRDTSYRLKDA